MIETNNDAAADPHRLDQLWTVMNNEKGDLIPRSEGYARWTLPHICPQDNTEGSEQDKADVAIGPRLVNHLANRVVDTMFPQDRPFFAITLTPDVRQRVREEAGEDGEAEFASATRASTAMVEEAAMRRMDLTRYRPRAVDAVKHLLISGNALIRRLDDDRRVVYGVKDYCIRRDATGLPQDILLRDAKRLSGLPPDVRAALLRDNANLKPSQVVTLYTRMRLDGQRWEITQAADSVMLPGFRMVTAVDLPVLPLVWNLARGDNYGRGLVEDHTTAFHQIDVLTRAAIDMAGIMADVKFLVDPASSLNVAELNAAPRGSYHQGRENDITIPDVGKRFDIAALQTLIAARERELSHAFLLNSSGVRDAERVTAEEIRLIALELESAFGGLYSRLALEWQRHEAEFAVSKIDFATEVAGIKAFEVSIVTGLESLSRDGQLESLRRAIADLALLDGVPEELRSSINPLKFASFVFTNHAVKWREFMFTQDEMAQNQQAAMQQQQDLMNAQSQADVQTEAGKQAVKEQQ